MKRISTSRYDLKKLYAGALKTPAKASQFVVPLAALLRADPRLKVVLYLRVSSGDQYRNDNLAASEQRMTRKLSELGVEIIARFRDIGSGWRTDLDRRAAAAFYAKKHGAVLVAESADRLLRSVCYTKKNQSVLPSLVEWEAFQRETQSVTVATLLDPDMPWQEVRGHQTIRGIIERGATCGRPRKIRPGDKKRRREDLLGRVLSLRHTWKCSYREIEAETGLPRSTFRAWIKGVRISDRSK